MDPVAVQRDLTRSILSSDTLSAPTRNSLFLNDLQGRWQDDPRGAIAVLNAKVVAQSKPRRDDVFALAELSFAYAEQANDPAYDRAAAVYAWFFLFATDEETPVVPFDLRTRVAADLYNRGLAQGFAGPDGNFLPREGRYQVPFGYLDVYFDTRQLERGQRRLTTFVPVSELEVEGLSARYRSPGIGAPLAASTVPIAATTTYDDFVQPWAKVPVTALLRIDDVQEQLRTGRVAGFLTLEFGFLSRNIDVGGKQVPLETEPTATLAYTLAESPVWQREISGFLQRAGAIETGTRLASLQPYRPGKIPIVLVHGTASSPGRWAEMMNNLVNDPRIGPRVQGWLFTYDTGNPIPYSAMLLRESLKAAVARLDPEGKDPALRDMVVIGHSQGGLLAKMTAIDSGDRFWRLISNDSFDSLDLDPEDREVLRKSIFIKPVPSVKRVIYLATPQHGSYVAGSWIAQQLARLVSLPTTVTRMGIDLATKNPARLSAQFTGIGTSIRGMTPGSPFIETLASIPTVPDVKTHSIIAVTDPDEPREDATDGVVAYKSAHIDGVESELVVTSGHSCQDNPHTIEEVRRILLEHIAAFDAAQGAPGGAGKSDAGQESTRAARPAVAAAP
jgi:pimeloyl-ACP methyl ester carboxylesterase